MSSASASVGLDLTPAGLFPKIETAATDPKCVVISEVMRQLTKNSNLRDFTQATAQNHATQRYTDLSKKNSLSLSEAGHKMLLLHEKGVSEETVWKYYSLRLSEGDTNKIIKKEKS